MTDIDLLVLGCAVTFIAVGGAYVYVRERYLAAEEKFKLQPDLVRGRRRRSRRRAA